MGCGGSKSTAVTEEKGSPQKNNPPPDKTAPTKTSPEKTTTTTKTENYMSPSKSHQVGSVEQPKQKYVVNDNANANGNANGKPARSDSVFSEATDKGFKKKLREKLREATAGSDIEGLEKAMDRFTRHNLDDCGDFSRAQDRLEYLKLRRDLRDAVRRSHVGILKKTIEEAENSQFSGQLQNQIEAARRKLQHLMELNEYKHDILNMEQTTISEIHSYQRPPVCVHDVMVATYLLLGHPEPRLKDWADIQMLLCRVGRDSLIHEIRDFDSANVDQDTNHRVQEILRPHELHTIRVASNGAATFYVWSTQICEKVDRDSKEEGQQRQEDVPDSARTEQPHGKTDRNSPRKKQKG